MSPVPSTTGMTQSSGEAVATPAAAPPFEFCVRGAQPRFLERQRSRPGRHNPGATEETGDDRVLR